MASLSHTSSCNVHEHVSETIDQQNDSCKEILQHDKNNQKTDLSEITYTCNCKKRRLTLLFSLMDTSLVFTVPEVDTLVLLEDIFRQWKTGSLIDLTDLWKFITNTCRQTHLLCLKAKYPVVFKKFKSGKKIDSGIVQVTVSVFSCKKYRYIYTR